MTAKIIDGNAVARKLRQQVADAVQLRMSKDLRAPGLAVVLVGGDPASEI